MLQMIQLAKKKYKNKPIHTNPAALMRAAIFLPFRSVCFVQETNLKCRRIMDMYTLL